MFSAVKHPKILGVMISTSRPFMHLSHSFTASHGRKHPHHPTKFKHVQGVHSSLGLLEEFLASGRDLKELEVDALHQLLQTLGLCMNFSSSCSCTSGCKGQAWKNNSTSNLHTSCICYNHIKVESMRGESDLSLCSEGELVLFICFSCVSDQRPHLLTPHHWYT